MNAFVQHVHSDNEAMVSTIERHEGLGILLLRAAGMDEAHWLKGIRGLDKSDALLDAVNAVGEDNAFPFSFRHMLVENFRNGKTILSTRFQAALQGIRDRDVAVLFQLRTGVKQSTDENTPGQDAF